MVLFKAILATDCTRLLQVQVQKMVIHYYHIENNFYLLVNQCFFNFLYPYKYNICYMYVYAHQTHYYNGICIRAIGWIQFSLCIQIHRY